MLSVRSLALLVASVCILQLSACHSDSDTSAAPPAAESSKAVVPAPDFNADQAYDWVKTQVDFGPRVPGTEAQKKCAAWMEGILKSFADTVYVQKANVVQVKSGKTYPVINLIASFNPQATDRVLILAHWDSRPWADEDKQDKDKPIDAADDGGSGVAVMMEMAARMKAQKPKVGVDLLFEDVEDVGKTEWSEDSYCVGTQYWARNPHVPGYRAMFGICLDMVGARGARFPLEGQSANYAGSVQREVWETARHIGYGNYFVMEEGSSIVDDHIPINTILKIPCIDIVNLKPNGAFADHWHTHQDKLEIIDRATLKAVGQTVMTVLYNQD